MKSVMVGIGELGVVGQPGQAIRTLALGSCVALILMDPNKHIVGMAHVALPESQINQGDSPMQVGRFADTAVPALLQAMREAGWDTKPNALIVKLAGGAQVMDPSQTFNIGKRNVLALKKALFAQNMAPCSEDIGGSFSRTVTVERDRGKVVITSPGKEPWEI